MIKAAGIISANYGDDDRVVLVSPKDIAAAAVEEIEANTKGKKPQDRQQQHYNRNCNFVGYAAIKNKTAEENNKPNKHKHQHIQELHTTADAITATFMDTKKAHADANNVKTTTITTTIIKEASKCIYCKQITQNNNKKIDKGMPWW